MFLGEMQISPSEMYGTSVRTLFNAWEGYQRKTRETWEQTRLQMWASMVPHSDPKKKALTITSVLPFTWDGESDKADKVDLAERRKRSQRTWDRIDKKNNKN